MVDHSMMKLGKLPPKHLKGIPLLSLYTLSLPDAPDTIDWTKKLTNLGMMDNDRLGDCTCATAGHMVQTWTANTTGQSIVSDNDILTMYEGACGYSPNNPATDQGGIETSVLQYWVNNPLSGHSISGFVSIHPTNTPSIKDAVWLLGGSYIGVALPITAQNQDVWDVTSSSSQDSQPGSWGGHAIPIVAYDNRTLTCITWGSLKKMTWAFFNTYCDEAYGVLSKDWFANNQTPSGFNWQQIVADYPTLG